MNQLLSKEPVKRVEVSLKKFDTNLQIIVLQKTARTAKDAASSLNCELGAIVKSLVFRAENKKKPTLINGICPQIKFAQIQIKNKEFSKISDFKYYESNIIKCSILIQYVQ